MTVLDHPERVRALHRGELAAAMVTTACELACLVRDSDREAVGEFLGALSGEQCEALTVVLAAMVPVDVPAGDLLSWVRWDEYGRPLPGPVLEAPAPVSKPGGALLLQPCGTYAAFRRHQYRGELIDDDCAEANRAYQETRRRARKVAATEKRHAA